jgi:small subunit ribosomal protein S6
MTFYEHTFVGKQDLSDKEIDNLVSKYSDIIEKSGKILKTEKWGLLNLATKIKRNRKGIFIHFKFEGKNKIVKDIEKKLSIEKGIIRYLTVKYNKLDLSKEYFDFKKKNKFYEKK